MLDKEKASFITGVVLLLIVIFLLAVISFPDAGTHRTTLTLYAVDGKVIREFYPDARPTYPLNGSVIEFTESGVRYVVSGTYILEY